MVGNGQESGKQREREGRKGHVDATAASGYLSGADLIIPFAQVVLFSFLLAVPFLAYTIAVDIDFGGRWICDPRPVGDFGVVHDRNGEPICQFKIHSALLFWTFWAAVVSPVPILVVYVRRISKQIQRLGAAGDSKAQERLSRRFFFEIGLCVAFAAVVGQGWPLSFLILPGAALAIYLYRLLRAVHGNEANR